MRDGEVTTVDEAEVMERARGFAGPITEVVQAVQRTRHRSEMTMERCLPRSRGKTGPSSTAVRTARRTSPDRPLWSAAFCSGRFS